MGERAGSRVDAFDGLRGLAVAAVLCFHAQFGWAKGGFLGVSAFFTLSGYLITTILLDERARTGRISLRHFYARRARRLLPAAYLTLAGVVLFGATVASGDQLRGLRADTIAAIANVANWRFYLSGQSYEHLFSSPSPVLHFWSLAIEEQFYLVFPLVLIAVLAVTRGRHLLVGGALSALTLASFAASWTLANPANPSRVYYGTDTRAAELLIGAVLAVVLSRWKVTAKRVAFGANAVGTIALLTMVWWWATVGQNAAGLPRGGFALHAILTAAVITGASGAGFLARGLGWRPLAGLGRRSYAVYLFHWPVFLWLSGDRTHLATVPLFALRLAITLTLAGLSYRFFEQPVLVGRRIRNAWPRLVVPATVTALVTALVAVTWSPPVPQIQLRALSSSSTASLPAPLLVAPPKVAPPTSIVPPVAHPLVRAHPANKPLRVMVVGDSVGITVGRGLQIWQMRNGGIEVDNIARTYCPLGRRLPMIAGLVTIKNPSSCDWTTWWRNEVARFDPDVTVMMYTVWESALRKLPGDSEWRKPGDGRLDDWQKSEYEQATKILTARGGQVVWMNMACEKDAGITKDNGLWYVERRTMPRATANNPAVHLVDLDGLMCPDGKYHDTFAGVAHARPDGAHFSDAGAYALSQWLVPTMLGQKPLPPYRTG